MKISIVYPAHFKMFYNQIAVAFKDCLEKLNHEVVIVLLNFQKALILNNVKISEKHVVFKDSIIIIKCSI